MRHRMKAGHERALAARPTTALVKQVALTTGLITALGLTPLPVLAQDADAVVEMTGGLNFQPSSLTIQADDTVEWRNVSNLPHTVTADPEKATDPSHVALPEGAEGAVRANWVEAGKAVS